MHCTRCARGLYLDKDAGRCLPCQTNCNRCRKNGKCYKCIKGYHPSTDKSTCVPNCELPCLTCVDGQPTQCRSCYKGARISGNNCVADLTCNLNNDCTSCPSGVNYVLMGANCLECPVIPKCTQCRQSNPSKCAICEAGYYPTDSGCASCPTGSTACRSAYICTGCVPGYTIVSTTGEGLCLSCERPCATCQNTQATCTSCVDGFTHEGWKCKNNINVGFVLVFAASDTATILAIINAIIAKMLSILGQSDPGSIIFSEIALGSVLLTGTVDGTDTTASQASSQATLISSGMSGTTVSGVDLTSSSVSTNGVSADSTDSSSGSSSKTGMIIGIAVAVPIVISKFHPIQSSSSSSAT